jgi:threonine dehydrogenase-like Zn-dependent dehydrogenase
MKAVVCQNKLLSVVDRPDPTPGKGQAVIAVSRCGICGSDLHCKDHCNHWGELMVKTGYQHFAKMEDEVIFGHEFCGEIVGYGPQTKGKLKTGTRIVAMPVRQQTDQIDMVGFSTRSAGAYAEYVLAEEKVMFPIPNGLSDNLAALTEPMAVAWHAVRRGEVPKNGVAVVIGCGPVGLAVICLLKARGVKTVIASDFSSGRRDLAKACGADVVIDAKTDSPYKDWADYGYIETLPAAFDMGLGAIDQLGKLPLPWWHAWRIAEAVGLTAPKAPVIFECVGFPGLLQQVISGAPLFSRVVVVGVCMAQDKIEPALAINKEIDLRFVLGYTPLEFRDTLHMIAEGKVNCAPMITGVVGLDGVANAFAALSDPEMHAKILIDPKSTATTPVRPQVE